MIHAEILETSDPRWARFLSRCAHDIFHLPGYLGMEARRLGGRGIAVLVDGGGSRMLMPLVLRELVVGEGEARVVIRDACSPYGYCPPLFVTDGEVTVGSIERLVAACLEELSAAMVCSLFVRLHPLLPCDTNVLARFGEVVLHGDTVWIDLRESPDEWWTHTRSSDRNRINRLKREGFVSRIDERWVSFADFVRIYRETMERLEADSSYRFSDEYFVAAREVLAGKSVLALVEKGADIVAASILTAAGDGMQYHLSGTATRFFAEGPSRLLIEGARIWGKERGFRWLHLGGGLGARPDSLFEFKRAFSKHRGEFRTWRVVVRPEEFAAAVSVTRAGSKEAADIPFFPPYRR